MPSLPSFTMELFTRPGTWCRAGYNVIIIISDKDCSHLGHDGQHVVQQHGLLLYQPLHHAEVRPPVRLEHVGLLAPALGPGLGRLLGPGLGARPVAGARQLGLDTLDTVGMKSREVVRW